MTDYPKVEFKHDLESCYITIKGRVFYIDMSGDTPGVTTVSYTHLTLPTLYSV